MASECRAGRRGKELDSGKSEYEDFFSGIHIVIPTIGDTPVVVVTIGCTKSADYRPYSPRVTNQFSNRKIYRDKALSRFDDGAAELAAELLAVELAAVESIGGWIRCSPIIIFISSIRFESICRQIE